MLERAAVSPPRPSSSLRTLALVGLGLAAAALAAAAIWAGYTRSTWDHGNDTYSPMVRGLKMLTKHPLIPLAIASASAIAIAIVGLMFAIRRGHRWPLFVAAAGSALAIIIPWQIRSFAWAVETDMASNTTWAARSPYVAAATTGAIAFTVFAGALAIVSLAAGLRSPKR